MSSCAQSYGSFDDTIADEQYFSPPGQSYASALTGNSYIPPVAAVTARIKEVIVPKATPAEIRDKATIASPEAEVKSLLNLLLCAQTLSTVTETSGPDTGETADCLATIESNMDQMTSQLLLNVDEGNPSAYATSPGKIKLIKIRYRCRMTR
jgi:hypothetical protein